MEGQDEVNVSEAVPAIPIPAEPVSKDKGITEVLTGLPEAIQAALDEQQFTVDSEKNIQAAIEKKGTLDADYKAPEGAQNPDKKSGKPGGKNTSAKKAKNTVRSSGKKNKKQPQADEAEIGGTQRISMKAVEATQRISLAAIEAMEKAQQQADSIRDKSAETRIRLNSFYKTKSGPVLLAALAVLVTVLIAVLILGVGVKEAPGRSDNQKLMDQVRSKNVVKCHIDSINEFFDTYYRALSSGNTTVLEGLYDDPEHASISAEVAGIVDHYSDLTVYVTPGLEQNDVIAYVYNNIHFNNILQSAPAVDSFYLHLDPETNQIKIKSAMYTDPKINKMMLLVSYREPVRSLLQGTKDSLYGALENNVDLRNLYIIMSSMMNEGK
ncbi:MAG: hypothetical protein HUJ75_01070 [Parasporobacterium sp.]|nr:hypothetical protein [Parasporobacterium sp.]